MNEPAPNSAVALAIGIADLVNREGLSQSEIAKATGVSQPLVSKLLSGDYGKLRPNTLLKLESFKRLTKEERQRIVNATRTRDVFLSHRSADSEFVKKLAADIEATDIDRRRFTVWIDEAEIKAGQSIPGAITHGLETSRLFAIVMTPAYFRSESGWTDAEWHALLHTDPDNRRRKIIPLLAADCPYIPFLLRHLHAIDMRGNRYKAGLDKLIAILADQPYAPPVVHRGQLIAGSGRIDRSTLVAERSIPEAAPDPVQESLYCNLLPIDRLPQYVYMAPIAKSLRSPSGALPRKEKLKEIIRSEQSDNERPIVPAFRIVGEQVVSFHDLETAESFLAPIVDENATVSPVEEFAREEEGRKIIVSLLHMAISRYAIRFVGEGTLISDESKLHRYFFGPRDGKDNTIEWRPVKNKTTRTVAKACTRNSHVEFWRHQAAYLKVVFLATKFYLHITPTWVLTRDGRCVIAGPKVGRIVSKWTAPERNMQVLYHVRFWTWALRRGRPGPISIRAGDQWMEIATVPASIVLNHGIADDQRDLMRLLDLEAATLARTEEEAADAASASGEELAELLDDLGVEADEDLDSFGTEEPSTDA
ncbi:helix-turn-helix protein [Phycisphaerae bacterium RAS2]|nr:helix-turn-helix protein [Phycisphaerae bacterium RAS2]